MSETEHNSGTLTPVPMVGDLEATAKSILSADGVEPKEYYDNFLEQLEDVGYRNYVIAGDKIYKVAYTENDPDTDIFKAKRNEDGTIDFETRYYNGGCGFGEAIEIALKSLPEPPNN